MIYELQDRDGTTQHDTFQHWRRSHPEGVFLTLETRTKANLHGSRCQHLGNMEWSVNDDGDHSLTKKMKVYADGSESLNSWAKAKSIAVRLCSHCLRDGFVDEDFFDEKGELPDTPPSEIEAVEGLTREVMVISRVRNGALREAAIARAKGICEACAVDFSSLLGGLGRRALHVHHRHQLALRDVPSVTKLDDLAVVCANCHSMIHADSKIAMPVEALAAMWSGNK